MPGLYIVTNRHMVKNRPLTAILKEAVSAGADAVILREKDMSPGDLYLLACRIKEVCNGTPTKLIINSSVEVALACGADGVHLGYGSLPLSAARKLMPGRLIGVSVHSPEEALTAQKNGADYVLAGHVFPTPSKPGQPERGPEFIRNITSSINIPVIAIGGIKQHNAGKIIHSGAAGFAVMSLLMEAQDVKAVVKSLRAYLP